MSSKQDLIDSVAESQGITKLEAKRTVEAVFNAAFTAIINGGLVYQGFGSFTVVDVPAQSRRNPRTGEYVDKPDGRKVKFKPSSELKKALS